MSPPNAATAKLAQVALRRARISDDALGVLRQGFEGIQRDPYFAPGFRFRAASRYAVAGAEQLELLPRCPLYQASEYNRVANYGGRLRDYPDLTPPLRDSSALRVAAALWLSMVEERPLSLSVHQFRTTAPGTPTPEGKHRDGNDWVGILVVDRGNLLADSGLTTVWDRDDRILFQGVLQPGELLSFDDRLTQHHTGEIVAAGPGEAWRDTLIFSAPDHSHYLDDAGVRAAEQ